MRSLILLSTLVLLGLIVAYHLTEAKIFMVETNSHHWHVAWTCERSLKLATELIICSICPLPGCCKTNKAPIMHFAATGFMSSFYFRVKSPALCTSDDVCPTIESVPVDVLMVMPMFLRSYLICRWMVLHSRQFKVVAFFCTITNLCSTMETLKYVTI